MTPQITARPDAAPFSSALLLADHEPNAATDRSALRAAGISRLRMAPSGLQVARQLAARVRSVLVEESELIVCLPHLADMNSIQFATLIRSHPLLAHIPLLAIAADPGQESALKKSGYNGVLLRPFNMTTLGNMLHVVARSAHSAYEDLLESLKNTPGVPGHDQFDTLLKQFTPLDKNSMSPETAYRHGVQLMRDYQWEEALPFLERAASDALMQGDASLALAAFWTVSQEQRKVEGCLQNALQAFMDNQAWGKAMRVSQRLSEEFPEAPTPILPEVERRARQNQYDTVLNLIPVAQAVASPLEIGLAILRGGKASLTPGMTLSTLIHQLREQGYADLADIVAGEAGESAKHSHNPWVRFRGKKKEQDGTDAPSPSQPASSFSSGSSGSPGASGSSGARQESAEANILEELLASALGSEMDVHPAMEKSVGIELADHAPSAAAPHALPGVAGDLGGESGPPGQVGVLASAVKPRPAKGKFVPDDWKTEQAIAPLGQSDVGLPYLSPSPLGDAWTMVRGTLRLNKKKKN